MGFRGKLGPGLIRSQAGNMKIKCVWAAESFRMVRCLYNKWNFAHQTAFDHI